MTQSDRMVHTFGDTLEVSLKIIKDHSETLDDDIATIDEIAKNLCILENDFTTCKTALQTVASQDDSTDHNQAYQSELNQLRNNFSYKNHAIWKRLHGVSEEEPEDSIMDESLVCSNTFSIPVDPLTKRPVKNACRNTVCNHIYEYDTIMQYLSRKTTKNRCPYIGCTNNMVAIQQIQRDEQLQHQINNTSIVNEGTNCSIVNISM